jgi:hypothetical protein
MLFSKKSLLPYLCIIAWFECASQNPVAVDSMKRNLAAATTPADKVYWLDNISRTVMSVNLKEADSIGKVLIQVAEESRDRSLMIKAYTSNGLRSSYF